jgi:uncharacterized protein (DUF2236 family)
MHRVSEEAFEAGLAALEALPGESAAGFFGPSSMMWRVGRESLSFLGAGAAILLQTAHPFVAQAVADHSQALNDPIGRFYRTFRPFFAMIYGTRAQALAQARLVRRVHQRIRGVMPETVGRFPVGTVYAADDADALFWVHATLWHTNIAVAERMRGLLSTADKDQYHAETARFAALFGIPPSLLAKDWAGFEARFAEMARSDMLGLGTAGRLIGGHFFDHRAGPLGRVIPDWYRRLTASLLPPTLAEAYGLSTGEDVDQIWRRLSLIYRAVPPTLRLIGPYREARYRLQGRGPGLLTQTLNRAWIGRPRLDPVP